MPSPADREKALESALAQIDRQFGKGSVMRLGSDERAPVEVISTGSIALDVALGVGGLPRGRIVEIYGPESSGKTTLTLHAIANAQRAGGIAAFIDAEHALDPDYAAKLGVDIDALLVSQPDTGEQALDAGVPPREIWLALCAEMDVPDDRRYGVGRLEPRRS
jgi:recombination protein RecA